MTREILQLSGKNQLKRRDARDSVMTLFLFVLVTTIIAFTLLVDVIDLGKTYNFLNREVDITFKISNKKLLIV